MGPETGTLKEEMSFWLASMLNFRREYEYSIVCKYIPGDSSRDLLIPQLEVTNSPLKGHLTIPKRSRIARMMYLTFQIKMPPERTQPSIFRE